MLQFLIGLGAIQAAVLDISKAFGRVWHAGIFINSSPKEFQVGYFSLIPSFPSNRQLNVVLDGKFSQYPVNTGVPQGSTLVPTLLVLYIKDLPVDVIYNIVIYADDTTGNNWSWLLNLNLTYKTTGALY